MIFHNNRRMIRNPHCQYVLEYDYVLVLEYHTGMVGKSPDHSIFTSNGVSWTQPTRTIVEMAPLHHHSIF